MANPLKEILSRYRYHPEAGGPGEAMALDRDALQADLRNLQQTTNRKFSLYLIVLVVVFIAGLIAVIVVRDRTFTVAMFAVEGFFVAGILRPLLQAIQLITHTNLVLVLAKYASISDLSVLIQKLIDEL